MPHSLVAGLLSLAFTSAIFSCSDYDNGYTDAQIRYVQNMKDVFGDIDHSQDWNAVEQGTLTVTPSTPTRVKVYANTFGTYKLVGDYENVTNMQDLKFDMVEGTEYLIVSDGQMAQTVKVGDGVALAGTRYAFTGNESKKNSKGEAIVSVGGDDTWDTFETEKYVVNSITDEDKGRLPEGIENLNKVAQNFSYVSQGPFVIYPIYINSNSSHRLGIYWKNGDEYYTQYVYRDNGRFKTEEWIPNPEDVEYNEGNPLAANGYRSKPITINLDEGTQFGFFLEVYRGADAAYSIDEQGYRAYENRDTAKIQHCVYSEVDLNLKQLGQPLDRTIDTGKLSYIANDIKTPNTAWAGTFTTTIDDETVMYLGFEDWGSAGKWDLNDLVFLMKGELPTILDDDAIDWVISAEDLGGTFDLDYNDVVVAVSHVDGREEARITPLAAGGTLASFIYFNGGTDVFSEGDCIGEIHSFFGQDQRTSGSYIPVNVGSGTPTKTAAPITLPVAKNWSLSSFVSTSREDLESEHAEKSSMGGFYVKVVEKGKDATEANAAGSQKIQNSVERNDDNVPYVICTPRTWKRTDGYVGTYRWPRESVPMFPMFNGFTGAAYHDEAHPNYTFEAWIKGASSESKEWYLYPNVSKTCGDFEPYDSGESGDDNNGGGNKPSVDYGTKVADAITTSTTVDAQYFAGATTKITLTFLYKAGCRAYVVYYTGQNSDKGKEIKDIDNTNTPTDTYQKFEITDPDWISDLKTYGITKFAVWNDSQLVLMEGLGGLWVKVE